VSVIEPTAIGKGLHLIRQLEKTGAVSDTGIELDKVEFTFVQCEALARMYGTVIHHAAFVVGDLLIYSENRFGETYAQIADAFGLAPQTLMNRVYVCNAIPYERRVPGLSFSTHALVAAMKPAEQKRWLKRASENNWSRAELATAIRDDDEDGGAEQTVLPPVEEPSVTVSSISTRLRKLLKDGGPEFYKVERVEMHKLLTDMEHA
jgi:hypothetical protein